MAQTAKEEFDAAQAADLRSLALSWENFQLSLEEYKVACRFFEWHRAAEARNIILANVEANLDSMMALHKRTELATRG